MLVRALHPSFSVILLVILACTHPSLLLPLSSPSPPFSLALTSECPISHLKPISNFLSICLSQQFLWGPFFLEALALLVLVNYRLASLQSSEFSSVNCDLNRFTSCGTNKRTWGFHSFGDNRKNTAFRRPEGVIFSYQNACVLISYYY